MMDRLPQLTVRALYEKMHPRTVLQLRRTCRHLNSIFVNLRHRLPRFEVQLTVIFESDHIEIRHRRHHPCREFCVMITGPNAENAGAFDCTSMSKFDYPFMFPADKKLCMVRSSDLMGDMISILDNYSLYLDIEHLMVKGTFDDVALTNLTESLRLSKRFNLQFEDCRLSFHDGDAWTKLLAQIKPRTLSFVSTTIASGPLFTNDVCHALQFTEDIALDVRIFFEYPYEESGHSLLLKQQNLRRIVFNREFFCSAKDIINKINNWSLNQDRIRVMQVSYGIYDHQELVDFFHSIPCEDLTTEVGILRKTLENKARHKIGLLIDCECYRLVLYNV